jgi:two-component system nitrate/nitrite response regulator NarL
MSETGVKEVRILIVDDHLVVRTGLRMLIENQPQMKVVGMAANRKEALELAASTAPDVILLDLDLGVENGIDFLPDLREQATTARVLVLTGLKDAQTHRRAVKQGAMGIVLKEEAAEVLIKAIEKVSAGELWLDRTTMGNLFDEMTRKESKPESGETARITSLTDRERQIVGLIAEGLKNKQIGERLFISETTVTHHLTSVFSKLGVSDRLELVIYSFTHGLARMPQ